MIDLRLGLAPALVAELPATSCKIDRRRALVLVPADHRRPVPHPALALAVVTDQAHDLPASGLEEVTDQEFDLPANVLEEATDREFDHQANDLAAETDRADPVMATGRDAPVTVTDLADLAMEIVQVDPATVTDLADPATATVRDDLVMAIARADLAMAIALADLAMATDRADPVMETDQDDLVMETDRADLEMATVRVSATVRAIVHPEHVRRWPATGRVIGHRDTAHLDTAHLDSDRPAIAPPVIDHHVPGICLTTEVDIGAGILIGDGVGADTPTTGGPGQAPVQSPDGWPVVSIRHRFTTTTAQRCTTKATTFITTTR